MDVASTTDHWTASDGVELAYRRWMTPGPARGVLVGVHGMRSHAQWYERSSAFYAAAGYAVCFPDRRGSGLNRDTTRGITAQRLMEDLEGFVQLVRQEHPGVPVHMEAISWGGKLAVVTLARKRVQPSSLILIAPGGIAARRGLKPVEKLKVLTGRLFHRRMKLRIPLEEPELFTANPERLEYLRNDPLSLQDAPVDLLWASHVLDRRLRDVPGRLTVPTFLMLAGRDPICDNDRLMRFYDTLSSTTKQVKVYPEAGHTLEFEPRPEGIFKDVLRWLGRFERKS